MSRLLAFVLVIVVAVGAAYWFWPPQTYSLKQVAVLGTPITHNDETRLPNLVVEMSYLQRLGTIITRQEDGQIVLWSVKDKKSNNFDKTTGLFAVCKAKPYLLKHEEDGLYLVDLNNSERRLIYEGPFRYAAWNSNCRAFIAAEENAGEVRLFYMKDLENHSVIKTSGPVRNGLALSHNARFVAAAEGTYTEAIGHQTQLEIFTLEPNGKYRRATIKNPNVVYGLWTMAFSNQPPPSLVVGTQRNGKSGILHIGAPRTTTNWSKEGFDSQWVTAIGYSPQGRFVATGDENGFLRIWDAQNGVLVGELNTGQVIQSLAFGGRDDRLAASLWDSTIVVYDVIEN